MSAVGRNAPCHCGSAKKFKVCHLPEEEARRKPNTGEDAVILCMPTRGQILFETQLAIEQNMQGVKFAKVMVGRRRIVEARNLLARRALEIPSESILDFTPREWFVFWVDDDCWFPPGLPAMMLRCLREHPFMDALFAMFGARVPGSPVLAFRDANDPQSFPKVGIDCDAGDLVEIERAGFHAVMMRLSLLDRVGVNPFDVPADGSMGEDFAFCKRAKEIGARLFVGMQMPALHVDPRDGSAYQPGMPALMMDGNGVRMLTPQHEVNGASKQAEIRAYGLDAAESAAAKADAARTAAMQVEMEQRRTISAVC